MASSSIVGLICDITFPIIFSTRTWRFFIISGILTAFSFPLLTYLAIENASVGMFLFAAISWGIYFELIQFGIQSFIVEFESRKFFTRAWSLIILVGGVGTVTGPVLGSKLLAENPIGALITSTIFQLIALITALIFIRFHKKKSEIPSVLINSHIRTTFNLFIEVKYWKTILVRLWPAFVLSILFWILDATFWTFGGILGEDLFADLNIGWIILLIYNVPDLINSMVLARFSIRTHKKLYSQLCLALAGLMMTLIPVFESQRFMIAFIILASSFFTSSVYIFSNAVFSDLEERSGEFEIYVNAVGRSANSIGFIIGPLLAGLIADKFGYLNMFAIIGGGVAIISCILIVVTPRKLRFPNKNLQKINIV